MTPSVRYAKKAESDLAEILSGTVERWGRDQAVRYLDGLIGTFELLAAQPALGRLYRGNDLGWRRFEHVSHVVVYQTLRKGVRILRVVHKNRQLGKALR
jgi:toxin ParE1/3/4